MPGRVGTALKEHFDRSSYTGADDLVFCHPETGRPFDDSKMRKRFKAAIEAAGVRSIRFHDLRHTFGTRMAAAGRRCGRFRSGWDTATTRRRKSTPTTRPIQSRVPAGRRRLSPTKRPKGNGDATEDENDAN
jgi:integrase